jgi:SMC interacting uncharacterized protein involved in chromosome segregation
MNIRTNEDYKKVAEEQALALKKLNKRVRDKEKQIQDLYKEMAHLRNIIRKKGLIYD